VSTTTLRRGTPAQVAATAHAFASELGFAPDECLHVNVLELGKTSSVYRLSWRNPTPGSCILKQCAPVAGRRERALYESVVPALPLPKPHYFGSREDEERSVWLVLEDAGDTEPSLESPGSRSLLTEWAASLHVRGAQLTLGDLPDAGPNHFASRLADAESELEKRLADEEVDDDEADVLLRCAERCRELDALWPLITRTCSAFPRTIVHGDLVEENLRLLPVNDGHVLLALDWESAGWGVPAIDLARVDPDLYWDRTSSWLGGTRDEFDRLVLAGQIFGVFTDRWAAKSVPKVERVEARLATLVTHEAWAA
jgi:aminoglycoside phosphotransferase (APT) family kinase protein